MFLIELVLTYFLYETCSLTMNDFLVTATGAPYYDINLITIALLFIGAVSLCSLVRDFIERI